MKKKVLGIVLTTVLVLSLGLVLAAPVGAAVDTVQKGTEQTQPVGRDTYGVDFASAMSPQIITPVENPGGDSFAPEQYTDDDYFQVFDEQQYVVLPSALSIDFGYNDFDSEASICAGTVVNSHLIHFDQIGTDTWVRACGEIAFDGDILGLITLSDSLDATDTSLGLDVTYPAASVDYRGLEFTDDQDLLWVVGDTLWVDLLAYNYLDQIRVITKPDIELALAPEEAANPVGAEHCVTATVDPVIQGGVEVFFEVSGENTASGSATTDALGEADFCYTGGTTTGTDNILAYIDMDCSDDYTAGEPYQEATKTWVTLDDLNPPLDFNLVGEVHCVTASVTPRASGVDVNFIVLSLGNFCAGTETTVDGEAVFCYTGMHPGKDTIIAWLDTNGRPGFQMLGRNPDDWRCVTKYYLDHRITGGGNITEGRRKNAAKITFGGNVGIAGGEGLVGQYQINFHNVSNNDLDREHFHTTKITFLDFKWLFFCPQPDPPDDAFFNWARFKADGRFSGDEGVWSVDVRVADHGEGKNAQDTIRIKLYDVPTAEQGGTNSPVYDSLDWAGGDFPADWICPTLEWLRHELDGGNIQIHRVPPFSP